MDFVHFFTKYEQDYRLETDIKFDFLVWPTFEKIIDVSTSNVYWDTLYYYKRLLPSRKQIQKYVFMSG